MTHYLRKGRLNVVDVEAGRDDIRCVVCVDGFSAVLLEDARDSMEVIDDFRTLQEIRGCWWEIDGRKTKSDEFVRDRLLVVASRYGLQYVSD